MLRARAAAGAEETSACRGCVLGQKRLFDNPHPQQDVREKEGEVTAHRKQTEKSTAIEH